MTGHLLEADSISKNYGNVVALKDVSCHVDAGEVTCILGDNGAGKSSFIKILSGCHAPDAGRILVDGEQVEFASPRDARAKGIATVYQDLAMVPLMSIWRNFFLGAEPRKGFGPFEWLDAAKAKTIVRQELNEMGIDIRDPDQPVGTLSGGERQSVAIARAVYFGARVLILDEPTSALGQTHEAEVPAESDRVRVVVETRRTEVLVLLPREAGFDRAVGVEHARGDHAPSDAHLRPTSTTRRPRSRCSSACRSGRSSRRERRSCR